MPALSDYFDYKIDNNGQTYVQVNRRGVALLRLPETNKGTAFTEQERIDLQLEGFLPPQVVDIEIQIDRLYGNFSKQPNDISKYQFLRAVQERSEVLFYALLERYLVEMMPFVYTPTIGQAVQQFSHLYTTSRGLTLSVKSIDRVQQILENHHWHDVRMLVVTDSSAILGIGDQGMGGLAICIGKLALYTVGGGLCPFRTLPVNLDVGTNREDLLNDRHYLGIHENRLLDERYFNFVDQFVDAVQKKWPKAIIQWEDFAKDVAFAVLERYRDRIPSFNDDIQGTGAVVLAGLLSACRKKGETIDQQRVVVAGAGAGGVGVAKAIQEGMVQAGLSREQARRQMFVLDIHGLVVEGITPDAYKLPVAQFRESYQDWAITGQLPELIDVVRNAKPTVLVGLSGVEGLFTEEMIKIMAQDTQQPIIFPLSNPTANCEAVPKDIIDWTEGRAIVSTGSPFNDVNYQGQTYAVGQGNNAFIFPGLGFAAVLGECSRISDAMIIESGYALADYTAEHYLASGLIYPPMADLQKVSRVIALRVLAKALEDGSATVSLDGVDLETYIANNIWKAEYLPFVFAESD